MRHYFCFASTPRQEQGERQGAVVLQSSSDKDFHYSLGSNEKGGDCTIGIDSN